MRLSIASRLVALVLLIAGMVPAAPAGAHPLSPALLVLTERGEGRVDVQLKTPLRGAIAALAPRLPAECGPVTSASKTVEGTGVIRAWSVDCAGQPLTGMRVGFEGLDTPGATALVRVETRAGPVLSKLLTVEDPSFAIQETPSSVAVARSFGRLGVEHLLRGFDHVLFVVLLTWLIGWGRRLFWALTCFTLGHSFTLTLSSLGLVAFPTRPIEALIALSVVAAGAELARPDRVGLFGRAPYVAAGAFGTLHGMGFAGALAEVGLPTSEIPLALASFNFGIELGQLTVVLPAAALGWVAAQRHRATSSRFVRVPGYAAGTLAAVWFWQQLPLPGAF